MIDTGSLHFLSESARHGGSCGDDYESMPELAYCKQCSGLVPYSLTRNTLALNCGHLHIDFAEAACRQP